MRTKRLYQSSRLELSCYNNAVHPVICGCCHFTKRRGGGHKTSLPEMLRRVRPNLKILKFVRIKFNYRFMGECLAPLSIFINSVISCWSFYNGGETREPRENHQSYFAHIYRRGSRPRLPLI